MSRRLFVLLVLLVMLAACRREAPAPQPTGPETPVPAPEAPVVTGAEPLKDVIEQDPRFIIGISYPASVSKYPGLGAELQRYADAARAELMEAVQGMGERKPPAPYDLSLSFVTVVETPEIVAIAADGSSYTGGAHGNPMVARFVWLPGQDKLLKTSDLVVDAESWRDISDYVREQLHAALSQRIDADDLPPAERAEIMRSAGKMIDEGSQPEADAFSEFEPVVDAGGKVKALRFVFPPYQVGPYADGTQTVEVPASVLLPHVAAPYRNLFTGGT
jgi:Protein of unknown function (DUF3298)